MTPCIVCHTADHDPGRTIDTQCLDRIDHDLERIAELTAYAAANLVPETRPGNGGRTVPGSRPPLALDALDAALGFGVLPRLESWERMWREHAGLVRYGVATENTQASVARTVGFLRANLALMAESPDWPIDDLASDVRCFVHGSPADPDLGIEATPGLIRFDPTRLPPANGTRMKCPADHPDGDGRLCHARITYDRERPRDDIRCTRCGTTWTGVRLLLLALHDESQTIWAYPADILAVVDIPKRTLQRWGADGTIARDGTRYDLGAAWRHRLRVSA